MIRVNRAQVRKPEILDSEQAKEAHAMAEEFFFLAEKKQVQRRFEPRTKIFASAQVKEALSTLFHGKCAYCESKLSEHFFVIDHYRPKSSAISLEGEIDQSHYVWLSYEWNNLYPSCEECNVSKGSRFPISSHRRAQIFTPLKDLQDEKPLLLDPCDDDPEEHLVFDKKGKVASATDRGKFSIQIYGLNRFELVSLRKSVYALLSQQLAQVNLRLSNNRDLDRELYPDKLADLTYEFAGMRRQFIAQWLNYPPGGVKKALQKRKYTEFTKIFNEYRALLRGRSVKEQKEAEDNYQGFEQAQDRFSLEGETKQTGYYTKTRLIGRVEIRNFKAIENLDIDFSSAKAMSAPWLMLLGENGTGKSSVLQAIALTLAGEEYRRLLNIKPDDVLRYESNRGSVKVFLTNTTDPLELYFSRGGNSFEGNPLEPKVLLLAYGATRLLPRGEINPAEGKDYAHIENLFNPFIPLKDANNWLMSLEDSEEGGGDEAFNSIARAIHALLSLREGDFLIRDREKEKVMLRLGTGEHVPLSDLSDGYQTILALAVDIIAIMTERWPIMEIAEGIVLVDEIGSHLHPRWKMQIIMNLRKTFPRIQFVATTHNPLCLRGMGDGETIVMRRNAKGKILSVADLPSLTGLRVDQLLTSEYFGLESVVDPGVEALFQDYYALLGKQVKSSSELIQIEELKEKLSDYDQMGTTRRERMMLELIDEFLSKEPGVLDEGVRTELKSQTRNKVKAIWEEIENK